VPIRVGCQDVAHTHVVVPVGVGGGDPAEAREELPDCSPIDTVNCVAKIKRYGIEAGTEISILLLGRTKHYTQSTP